MRVGLTLLLLRLVLALVFFLAAGARALRRDHGHVLVERFALPNALAPAAGLLPVLEAATGSLMLFGKSAAFGAWACTALL